MEALARLEREERPNVRIRAGLLLDPSDPLDAQLEQAAAMRAKYRGPLLQANSVKFFADGSGLSIFLGEPFSAVPPATRLTTAGTQAGIRRRWPQRP